MSDLVIIESEGGLTTVRLNRPPANAIDLTTATALRDAFISLRDDPSTSALVLTGTGDCFCAGLDLKAVPSYTHPERRLLLHTLGEAVFELYAFPRPTVAALNGHAVAAGSLFTLCTDYRIAPDADCRFGFTGARVGMPYPDTAITVITSELGPSVARRLLLSARTFDQDAALHDGIVDELVPRLSVLTRGMEIAADMASMPHADYAAVKRQVRGHTCTRLLDTLTSDRAASDGVWVAAT